LTSSIESIQIDLAEKINRDSVELIVHKKYEDIVQYLHEALQASKSDEEMFNKKADELRDAVKRLGIQKADRFEIAGMLETMVKTESLLSKLKNQEGGVIGEKSSPSGDIFSKDEVLELLMMKLDRAEFDAMQLSNQRKSLLNTGAPDVQDNYVGPNYVKGEAIISKTADYGPITPATSGKIAPSFTSTGASTPMSDNLTFRDNRESTSVRNLPADFVPIEAKGNGKLAPLEGKGLMSPPGKGENKWSGHSGDVDRTASVRVPIASTDLGSFLKLSTLQSAGRAMFPLDAFRTSSASNESAALTALQSEYEFTQRADLSFVGGAVMGAGFNTRSANIIKGPLLHSSSSADSKTKYAMRYLLC
jgi:hypothetical protein